MVPTLRNAQRKYVPLFTPLSLCVRDRVEVSKHRTQRQRGHSERSLCSPVTSVSSIIDASANMKFSLHSPFSSSVHCKYYICRCFPVKAVISSQTLLSTNTENLFGRNITTSVNARSFTTKEKMLI